MQHCTNPHHRPGERMSRRPSLRRASLMVAMAALITSTTWTPPASAAERLPTVTVTSTRNPVETPVEVAYADALHHRLEKQSSYPTSREASLQLPSGTSTVWVDVQRNGRVVGHGLEQSSGSQILDARAVQLAARAKYPPLPTDGWAGQTKHRFVVSYRFDGAAATAGRCADTTIARP